MRQPTILALGHDAYSWVSKGGNTARGGWRQRVMLRWQCAWFERNLALQHTLPLATQPRSDPIFILGLWRSGTTYLHDLLCAPPGMIYPTTWQCMSPSSFRILKPPTSRKALQRPMDGFYIDALSPQEDEFALLALGIPSVYRGFLDPRRLPELAHWLDPNAWSRHAPAGWLGAWNDFLAGVAEGRSGRIVLKSPTHTFRVRALAEIFPRSTFVWLVRDSTELFHSNRKMWTAMFERYALWNWDSRILDDFICAALHQAGECLSQATKLIPPDRLAVMKFEDLAYVTLPTLEKMNCRLGLGDWQATGRHYARIANAKKSYRKDNYEDRDLPDQIRGRIESLAIAQHRALSTHGL